jgi:hypothetical protein
MVFNSVFMQRQMFCILFFLLIKNLSFSQPVEQIIGSQFYKIASSAMKDKEFIIGAYSGSQMFIVKRTKDSLFVTKYLPSAYEKVGGVVSISVNDDTLLEKTIDTLCNDVKQNHNYQSYSKEIVSDGSFFLTFYANNKLQIFDRKSASPYQLTKVNYIVHRLDVYGIISFDGHDERKRSLKIGNLNELLKFIKSGRINSELK